MMITAVQDEYAERVMRRKVRQLSEFFACLAAREAETPTGAPEMSTRMMCVWIEHPAGETVYHVDNRLSDDQIVANLPAHIAAIASEQEIRRALAEGREIRAMVLARKALRGAFAR